MLTPYVRVPAIINPDSSRTVKRLGRTQLSEERFKAFWGSQRPFVVKDLHRDLQACWEPGFFIQQYGDTACEVQDCETGKEQTSTVAEFFSLFGGAEPPKTILKLKVSLNVHICLRLTCSMRAGLAAHSELQGNVSATSRRFRACHATI